MRVKLISFMLLTVMVSLVLLSCTGNSKLAAHQITQRDTILKAKKDTLSIVAVGDLMLGSAYPSKSNLPADDARGSFKNVLPYLKGDIVFGNLEGCFLNQGKSTKCKDTIGNSCFAFRMPERYAGIYKEAGFNLLSVANNHVGDFGWKGRKRSAAILDSLGIQYAGLTSHPYTIFEKDSVKYGFCAFAPNEGTVSINNIDSARQLVSFLKKQVDIVIVSFHGGGEGARFEHVTRANEIFYQENRGNVYAFAHAVVDAGADIVLGQGPHVTRAVEVYKNKFIAYSLGNFCTYGMFSLKGPNGFAPLLQVKINGKGDFLYADVISVKQDKVHRLTIDTAQTAFKKIISLTAADFPGHNLKFTDQKIRMKD
ncbi:CapA family protein [Pedobacter cryoconitis]|uniref:Poly-gamma-glutamate capsule biosynthesis protein CapA/YwtB (Metallophosphatase superfamily) n=1 Tax=Pedobacter cryoconitis TaxID=188932 RepID=A0A7X0J3J4_9SPHI|nr:CapA family protein [Pedobacter cryoconitis]MBB6499747.1 poly-gamma-glutamate capsule biosynthesis protein CapA/YwtB (metallophosphatase superfamily) [Pedobacter cryoconitis]